MAVQRQVVTHVLFEKKYELEKAKLRPTGITTMGVFKDKKFYEASHAGMRADITAANGSVLERWWEGAEEFNATLTLTDSTERNGSFRFLDEKNMREYIMLPSDVMDMLRSTTVKNGKVSGRFGYVKRATTIGIAYLGD